MKKNLYAIYDKKSNNYGEFQWQEVNDECAIRTVAQMANDIRPNKINANPSDYELYRLGQIDLETGVIEPRVEFMKNITELKKPEDQAKKQILDKLAEIYKEIRGE